MLHWVKRMDELSFTNLIGGKEIVLSGETFPVKSTFYEEYLTKAPNSNIFDIKTAISKAKSSIVELSKLRFENRMSILKAVAKKFHTDSADLEYVVKMTGMPISNVEEKVDEIKELITTVPDYITKRFQIIHGKIGTHIFRNLDMLEIFEPVDGFVYVVTPGNDIRIVPFVVSWLVTVGIPGIIKVSKNDLVISQKIVKATIDSGYPESALNIDKIIELKKLNSPHYKESHITVGGTDAIRVTGFADDTYIKHGNAEVIINSIFADNPNYPEIKPALNGIISTFKFIDPTVDWKVYTHPKYGFEFKYPKVWVVENFDQGDYRNLSLEVINPAYPDVPDTDVPAERFSIYLVKACQEEPWHIGFAELEYKTAPATSTPAITIAPGTRYELC